MNTRHTPSLSPSLSPVHSLATHRPRPSTSLPTLPTHVTLTTYPCHSSKKACLPRSVRGLPCPRTFATVSRTGIWCRMCARSVASTSGSLSRPRTTSAQVSCLRSRRCCPSSVSRAFGRTSGMPSPCCATTRSKHSVVGHIFGVFAARVSGSSFPIM